MHTNLLARENSPYLLQHAHNPVNWHPWGGPAFQKAREESIPIFLSVGYSTCHWCHVMERESFEDTEIARLLNSHFVPVKVDREERPDIDRVYMTYVQATTGGGGWPMSVWLTPDLKPFYGGTYFAPAQFKDLLTQIANLWQANRPQIISSADSAIEQLRDLTNLKHSSSSHADEGLIDKAHEQIKSSFDRHHGGFGGPPKFPQPAVNNFMFHYFARTGSRDALEMSLFSLRKMADGGIHDHIGGGFHRYSVDKYWHVPHFEKMLYDQAQIAASYLGAFQITHDRFYAGVARDILEYVLTTMTGSDGQFLSAEDADSPRADRRDEHAEGAFYTWRHDDIVKALGREDADVVSYHYGIEPGGNVQSDPRNEFVNLNIPLVRHTIKETSDRFNIPQDRAGQVLAAARTLLRALRSRRPRPFLDDKALTSWNGLMISALAKGHQVLDETRYLHAAQKATAFIESHLYDRTNGRLLHRYRAGNAAVDGHLDDYAFFIQALLDLYEADFDARHLTTAAALQEKQDELFWDEEGAYRTGAGDDPNIILNMKEAMDGAEPSANSVSVMNLLRLAQITDSRELRRKAGKTIEAFAGQMHAGPASMPQMMAALGLHLDKPEQIVIAGKPGAADTAAMLREVHARFIPNKILLLADGGVGQETLSAWLRFVKAIKPLDGKATAYVCRDYTCKRPTNDVAALAVLLATDWERTR
ncbi:MAG: thioredoxin domain-containing protein [Verrucomicrobia bacterium]|nr:thioredoxin domain-containing protein [Verrucomicrobiota bacterium]